MKPRAALLSTLSVLVAAVALWACGTDGASSVAADGDRSGGGISGTGIAARGTITAFGSVVVNDIEFEVDDQTVVTVDGESGGEGQLRIGMVVRVEGTYQPEETNAAGRTPGIAASIEYADEVEGPLKIAAGTGETTVLGRVVRIDPANTQIVDVDGDPVRFDDLEEDDLVEISGFLENGDTVRATYVARKEVFDPARDAVETQGIVQGFPTGDPQGTFSVGAQEVRFTLDTEFSDGEPADGDRVSVEGWLAGDGLGIDAVRIEIERDALTSGEDVDVEGVVGSVDPVSESFILGGVVVDASRAEIDGGTFADIAPGTRVEVEGTVNDEGVLVAQEVEIEDRHGQGGGDAGAGDGGNGPGEPGEDSDDEEETEEPDEDD